MFKHSSVELVCSGEMENFLDIRCHVEVVCFPLSGPFGERDDQQVFIQKIIPITNKLFVRLSSTGKRYNVVHVLLFFSAAP